MKGVVAAFVLVLLVGLGVWLLFMQPPVKNIDTPTTAEKMTDKSGNDLDAMKDPHSTQLPILESMPSETDVPAISDELRAEQLAQAKAQLDDLILVYNENLTDSDARKKTQGQINKLLKQYNELILPVALAKIREN